MYSLLIILVLLVVLPFFVVCSISLRNAAGSFIDRGKIKKKIKKNDLKKNLPKSTSVLMKLNRVWVHKANL